MWTQAAGKVNIRAFLAPTRQNRIHREKTGRGGNRLPTGTVISGITT
jgi:hypothetical protein